MDRFSRPGATLAAALAAALALALPWVLAACATAPLPPAPHPGGEALWRIVHQRCVPGQQDHDDPAPCVLVRLSPAPDQGYAVLKDRRGVAQYLLVPTDRITGVEDPLLLSPGTANVFALAWNQRRLGEARLGRPLDRGQVSVAVNSAYGRSQDQLHLHIDCVDRTVARTLAEAGAPPAGTEREETLKGRAYHVRWLDDGQLAGTSPFVALAAGEPGARRDMAAWTLALVGGVGRDGRPGFYLLTHRARPQTGDPGSAEELQDHDCKPD